ncbi:MAG TPA: DNA-processing protein DprA [Desulfobacterales bacterium]|nr:DNA-processing protein DprA [Desulfobacterales bacterium]
MNAHAHAEELLPWFELKAVPGVGNHLFKRLIERFGSPAAALRAPAAELGGVEGISRRTVEAMRSHRASDAGRFEIEAACRSGFGIVTMSDPAYPRLLREIPDPPPMLYVHGELEGLERPIAVVGSRHATAYGLDTTRRLCADLAAIGFTVVSGMAVGIDAAAHEGALAGGGRTVAVLGSGLANVYPPQHRRLFERIAARGAVVSEFPIDAGPEAHHFPVRNRIISGMSLGTVVVEATRNSGSLITARLAAEQNREVFAVPGSVQSFKSTGTHTLIKQGAKLVENVQDIVDELGGAATASVPADRPAPVIPVSAEEARVLGALGPYPLHIDELVRSLSLDAGSLSGILLQLELKGLATQQPGKLFSAGDGKADARNPWER